MEETFKIPLIIAQCPGACNMALTIHDLISRGWQESRTENLWCADCRHCGTNLMIREHVWQNFSQIVLGGVSPQKKSQDPLVSYKNLA